MWKLERIKRPFANCLAAAVYLNSFFFCSLEADLEWSSPVNVSMPGKDAFDVNVSISPRANASIVWTRPNGSHFVIQTATSKIGGLWSRPFKISCINKNAFLPDVATDRNGNTIAVWTRSNGTNFVIQSAYKVSHCDWSAPVAISSKGPSQNATNPKVAFDPNGNAAAVWQRHYGVNSVIECAQKKFGQNWSKPVKISIPSTNRLGSVNPNLTIDSEGNVIAVWINDSTSTVQSAKNSQNGQWSLPVDISKKARINSSASVAVDGSGNATAVWVRGEGVNHIIQTASMNADGIWSEPFDLTSHGESAISPQIAVDEKGNQIVVWQWFNGANTIIQAAMLNSECECWYVPYNLSEPGQDASDPQVVIDAEGRIAAIWKRSDGANYIIQAATSNFDTHTWSAPVSISEPGEDAHNPQIAINSLGHAVAAWLISDKDNSIVQASFGTNTETKAN